MRDFIRSSTNPPRAVASDEWASDTGAMAVMVALLLGFALIGLAAVATDIGFVAQKRAKLQVAADSAALAAASSLPGNPGGAAGIAADYAARNATLSKPIDFVVDGHTVMVTAYGDAPLGLARIWGKETQPARATASAIVGSPTTMGRGLMPYGLMARGSMSPPYGLPVSEHGEITLELASGAHGNYQMVDLTAYAGGPNTTKGVITQGGTTSPVSIGTIIPTQPGTPDVPNYKALNGYLGECSHTFADLFDANGVVTPPIDADGDTCNRLITIPVVVLSGVSEPACYAWETATGASKPVKVIGFAHAFVQGEADPKTGTLTARLVQIVDSDGLSVGPVVDWAGIKVELSN